MPLPKPPAEVPVISRVNAMAPKMQDAVLAIVKEMADAGHNAKVFETLRTEERQAFLYGFGRKYDDGRGTVTKVEDAWKGWHAAGLAVDIVENDSTPWTASQAFWNTLGVLAKKHGLAWGGNWKFLDLPHMQLGSCPIKPTAQDSLDMKAGRLDVIWKRYGAE